MTTLRQRLSHYVLIALYNISFVGMAMWNRAAGVGAMAGMLIMAVVTAIREHRHEQRKIAERERKSALLDRQLVESLDKMRASVEETDLLS